MSVSQTFRAKLDRQRPGANLNLPLALLVCSLAAPAAAQEVVVTAERRPQAVSSLASNAAALGAEELALVGAQAPNEALGRLPGVAIHRNNGLENLPAIRSPVLNGSQSAGSFLVLEDGVPIRAPGFANVNQLWEASLDFASSVEVVRGPGSALYGSNAVHGLVNVITPRADQGLYDVNWEGCPASHKTHASGAASVGSFGRAQATALVRHGHDRQMRSEPGGMCPDEVLPIYRAASMLGLSVSHERGWRDASGFDTQQALIGWDGTASGWRVQARLALQNLNQETAGYVVGTDAYKDEALSRANSTPEAYRDTQLARAHVTLERALAPDWTLRLTPYARWIDADLNITFLPSRAQELSTQSGGGLQSALYWDPTAAFTLILGADVDQTRGALYEFQSLPDQGNGYLPGLHYDYDVDMGVAALYAQARWAFAEDWRLIAGLRGEHVSYEYDNHAPDGDYGRYRRPADREDSFDALTPKLGVVWTPLETQSYWLNFARGARAPQITDLYSLQTTQAAGEQDVEKLDSVELGWRGRWGDAAFEAALYHMDKRDSSFRNAAGFNVTDADTRHEGIELSGRVPLGAGFALSGWISYARHTYAFDDAVSRAGESIHKGDDIDSAPRRIGNLRLSWRPLDGLETELEWVHMGAYYTNAENTARYDGHDIANLRALWRFDADAALTLALRNVTDEAYAERADFSFGNDRYFPGEPRALTVGLRFQ